MSEALGFSTGNIRAVTVIAVWFSTLFSQFILGTCADSRLFFVVFAFWFCCWFVGQVASRLGFAIWFLGLFRGFLTVFLGVLGFLLLPCAFWGHRLFFGVEFKVVGLDCCFFTVGTSSMQLLLQAQA